MPKYLYTTKEVASKFNLNINYTRVIAKNFLKLEKIGQSYMFNKQDIKKLQAFMQENPIAKD